MPPYAPIQARSWRTSSVAFLAPSSKFKDSRHQPRIGTASRGIELYEPGTLRIYPFLAASRMRAQSYYCPAATN